MRRNILAVVVLALAVSLGGCETFERFRDAVANLSEVQASPKAISLAVNSFNLAEIGATSYNRLPRCVPTNRPVCRDRDVAREIDKAIRSGRIARDELILFVETHPGKFGPQGVYDALKRSVEVLKQIYARYNIGGTP